MTFYVMNADSLFIAKISMMEILKVKLRQIFLPPKQLPITRHSKFKLKKVIFKAEYLEILIHRTITTHRYSFIYFSMKNTATINE